MNDDNDGTLSRRQFLKDLGYGAAGLALGVGAAGCSHDNKNVAATPGKTAIDPHKVFDLYQEASEKILKGTTMSAAQEAKYQEILKASEKVKFHSSTGAANIPATRKEDYEAFIESVKSINKMEQKDQTAVVGRVVLHVGHVGHKGTGLMAQVRKDVTSAKDMLFINDGEVGLDVSNPLRSLQGGTQPKPLEQVLAEGMVMGDNKQYNMIAWDKTSLENLVKVEAKLASQTGRTGP